MKKHIKNRGLVILLIVIILIILLPTSEKTLSEENVLEEQVEDDKYRDARERMIETQLKIRGITDENTLGVIKEVLRHEFVPENMKNNAYEDRPLPIGYGQTISQPYIVALMTQSLELEEDDNVLEIGTGSGYQAAVLAGLVERVYTIEIIKELADAAKNRLKSLGYENVEVKHADGYFGWEEQAPFDAIIVTAAANHIPPPLLRQLKDGGKLIIPLGSTLRFQTLTIITKFGNETETKFITGVRFVPLTGEVLE